MKYAGMKSLNDSRNFIIQGNHSLVTNLLHAQLGRPWSQVRSDQAPNRYLPEEDLFLMAKEENVLHGALLRHMGPPSYMNVIETFLNHHEAPVP